MNSLKIFIVDDELSIVDWLIHFVEWEVYNCEIAGFATSAAEAVSYIEENQVDLLITDICMPKMSGLDLIRRVKEKYGNIHIIVISAFDKFAYVKEAFRYGIIDYCLKPIDVNELYDCLKSVRSLLDEERLIYKNQDAMMFQNCVFQRLLNGENDTFRIDEQCQLAGIRLDASVYQVVLIDKGCTQREKYVQAVHQLSKKKEWGFYSILDTHMSLVCLFMGKTYGREEEKQIKYVLQQECGIYNSFFCVGKPVDHYRKIAAAYQACRDFLNASFLFSGHKVRLEDYSYEKYANAAKNKELWNLVNNLKIEKIENVIDRMHRVLGCGETEEEKKAEFICQAVFLFKNINQDKPNRTFSVPKERLDVQVSYGDMLKWWNHFYSAFVREDDSNECFHPHVKYALKEICSCYSNANLCLGQVAQDCHISAAYLGKIFREQTGEFFNDYLLKLRLKAAESLLLENKLRIGVIAEKVGFSNQSYFNKMFRRKYGISPAAYRNQCLNGEKNL